MGLNGVVSGYSTSTNLPWVDRLSMHPWDLGCHKNIKKKDVFVFCCLMKNLKENYI